MKAKLQQKNVRPQDGQFASLWKSVDRALNEDGRLRDVEADSTVEALTTRPSDRTHPRIQAGRLQPTAERAAELLQRQDRTGMRAGTKRSRAMVAFDV